MTTRSDDAREAFYDALLDDDAEQLYDRAPCGYLSTTPDGTIVKVNQTFLTLTGYPRDQLVGRRRFVDLLSPGGRIYHETHYAPMLQMQGNAREIALDLVAADRSRVPVLVNAVLERNADGTPRVVRTAVFDARERRRYERELVLAKERAEESEARARALAQTLQQTLVPPAPPEVPGLDVAALYRPAGDGSEVGGDFYDVFQLSDETWVVAVGDVRGKGVRAAIVTSLARHTLRAAAVQLDHPSAVLATLNTVLLAEHTDRFCTVALLRLRRTAEGWSGALCCGGHPLPLLVRRPSGLEELGQPGTLLGVLADPALHDAAVDLRSGDFVLLFTDGVLEARRGTELYGEDRLRAVLSEGSLDSAGTAAQAVLDDVLAFQAGTPRDDIVIVALRVP